MMNVSLKWLGTLVDIKGIDVEEMAETLTVDGIPVEHVMYPGRGISGVVTGKILEINKHPDAEKLFVCRLDVGNKKTIQVVTGASNVQVGQIVPVALPGAHIPARHEAGAPGGLSRGDTIIESGELRGIKSDGMICSAGELGLDADLFPDIDKEGIMVLPEDTKEGMDIHELFDLDDVIYEMELTANRSDCFSMIGMAMEVAGIFERKLALPVIKVVENGNAIEGRAFVHIENAEYCKRFCGRLLENVKVGRSPVWIENRLRSNGIRPINNIVDAANYVMLETGQPLHTYDYDKVSGHSLTCRFAKEDEKIITLDKNERVLNPTDLVISDGEGKAICVAGVMGGLDTEVTENTKNVFLEAAVFDSASVRRTSRRLGLRSEASGRYERGIHPSRTELAIDRISQILIEQGACTVASGMVEQYPIKPVSQVITTTVDAINRYIGIDLPKKSMIDILRRLHFKVHENDGVIKATVPEFRLDVCGMPDLAEEVARVYGYANIPITTPWSAITKGMMSKEQEVLFAISDRLINKGLSQVINYSFMDKKDLEKLNFPKTDKIYQVIPVLNPISEEYPDMRTSLLPGLLHTLKYNLAQKNKQISVFEHGHVYEPKSLPLKELPNEYAMIAGVLCGNPAEKGYPNVQKEYDFFDIKAIAEDILSAIGIRGYKIERTDYPAFHPGISARFVKSGVTLITFGEFHPRVLDLWGIKEKVYGFVLSIPDILPLISNVTDYHKIPKFPAVERDLAILVPEYLSNEAVENIILQAGIEHLEKLVLFDLYQGKQVPDGFKSMAYNLSFRAEDRTLTDKEVELWIKNIIAALEKEKATLRTE